MVDVKAMDLAKWSILSYPFMLDFNAGFFFPLAFFFETFLARMGSVFLTSMRVSWLVGSVAGAGKESPGDSEINMNDGTMSECLLPRGRTGNAFEVLNGRGGGLF